MQNAVESRADELNERVATIRAWEQAATIDEIRTARITKMLGFNIRDFPRPQLASMITTRSETEPAATAKSLVFHDVAESVGVKSSFVSEYPLDAVDFYLYQANGGGLAALDYDLDGRCDLYVAQSGGDPNQPGSSEPNQLYRHLPEATFDDVSTNSMTGDRGYGQGVCAGWVASIVRW